MRERAVTSVGRACAILFAIGIFVQNGPTFAQSGCYPGLACPERPASNGHGAGGEPPPPPPATESLNRGELTSIFQDYISAWRIGDIDSQDNLLSANFSYSDERGQPSGYQGRRDYLAQKRKLSSDNDWIEIKTSSATITVQGTTGTISYRQLYNNPRYCSLGTNKFLVRKEGGVAKIFREVFNAEQRIPKSNAPTRACPASLS